MRKLFIIIIALFIPAALLAQNSALETAKNVIKHYEGCALKAYKCPAGVWTIGYGNTSRAKAGKVITREIADLYLSDDAGRFENYVNKSVRADLEPNKKAALISLTFNCGYIIKTGFKETINKGTAKAGAERIKLYCKARGKVLKGLVRRRSTEAALYETSILKFY